MHKAKDIGPMSDPNEELSTHNLAKAEYFDDFFVNISKNLTKQLDPLDISSPNTFIDRITPSKDNVVFSRELVKYKLMKAAKMQNVVHKVLTIPSAIRSETLLSVVFSQQTDVCIFHCCNHFRGPVRKQKFTSTGSKGHVCDLWLVNFDLFCVFLCFKVRCLWQY